MKGAVANLGGHVQSMPHLARRLSDVPQVRLNIYIYIYICIHICIYIYIYIYIERERGIYIYIYISRERERDVYTSLIKDVASSERDGQAHRRTRSLGWRSPRRESSIYILVQ